MKLSKFTKVSIVIVLWAVGAFLMSMFYYYLKTIGLIWDNADTFLTEPKYKPDFSFNSRKVILGITAGAFLLLTIVKIADIVSNDK